ncbi:anaphase-promoting complex subunit 5 [Octopus bimaculoides]|uniref:Anaphase-promoting complex subunit 5 n=1 Tax=Octopus bimaculoides TaxID=37653 RepID=A0A0L8FQL3_OCTBM|nr:anaphase-promoting complex subunit 5 [Octopus bimaculoides]|eukprot:XP_014787767.1 PREDICTED: anaphase-promoting complex subunit 5-like [Octopus bimaculoides]
MSYVSSGSDLFMFEPSTKRSSKEQVTSHKVTLLVLLYEFLNAYEKKSQIREQYQQNLDLKVEMDFTDVEVKAILTLILDLYQGPEKALRDLIPRVKKVTNAKLADRFTGRLTVIAEGGIRALNEFFNQFTDDFLHFSETLMHKSSLFGLFARRMMVTFNMLSLSEVVNIFNRFHAEMMSITADKEKNCRDSVGPDDAFGQGKTQPPPVTYKSQKQAEYYIANQAFLIHHNVTKAAPPNELQERIRNLLKENPNLAEAHFLSYLNNIRVKEFCTASHNLYHYFDRYVLPSVDQSNVQQFKTKENIDDSNRRYAALNLAALHFSFGHKEQAIAALREAIRMAQENNDHLCLQHALVWLHRLGDEGSAETAKLMKRQISLPALALLNIQSLAKYNAFAKMKPANVIESMLSNNVLSSQFSHGEFACISLAQIAALWHTYGKRENCSLISQLILHLDTSDAGIYRNEESVCIAMCNLARHHFDQGMIDVAMVIVEGAKERFPANTSYAHIWMATEQEMKFTLAVYSNKWSDAEMALVNLKAVCETEADIRCGILLKERGQVNQALTHMHQLLEKCEKNSSETTPFYTCRVLLELSDILRKSGNLSIAIFYVLRCITLARDHHFQYILSLAIMQLAQIQILMGLPHLAIPILEEQMMNILTNGTLVDKGRMLYCYSRCTVAAAKKSEDPKEIKSALMSAIRQMCTVIEYFQTVEAYQLQKDALYYQSRICESLAYTAERNRYAREFRHLDQLYPSVQKIDVTLL